MRVTILGSGGAITTPRLSCTCTICRKARKFGEPYKRNSSSLFIDDIDTIIDCGEDIADSIYRRKISKINNIFITHWHPDHTFGLRYILESKYNFRYPQKSVKTNLFIPHNVLCDLKEKYPIINYLIEKEKVVNLKIIKDKKKIKIDNFFITPIRHNKKSNNFAYLISEKDKNLLYSPCDTKDFNQKIPDLNLLITENGVFENHKTEIIFPDLVERLRNINVSKIVLTHIEEIDLRVKGWNYLDRLKRQYSDINFDFAFDGMEIRI